MNLDDEIRARIDAFVADLRSLINAAAIQTVQNALGGSSRLSAPDASTRPQSRLRAGTKRRSTTRRLPAAARQRPSGSKRTPAEIGRLQVRLLEHVRAMPGQRIEQIGKALKVATKDLTLPARKLIDGKKFKTKGQKRATTYWPR